MIFSIFSSVSDRISFFHPNVNERSSDIVIGEMLMSSTASSSVKSQSLINFCLIFLAVSPSKRRFLKGKRSNIIIYLFQFQQP